MVVVVAIWIGVMGRVAGGLTAWLDSWCWPAA